MIVKFGFIIILVVFMSAECSSQDLSQIYNLKSFSYINQFYKSFNTYSKNRLEGRDVALGTILIFALVNPELVIENKKVYFGLTREISIGFGREHILRASLEYSYIFRHTLKSQFRYSLKYDIQSSPLGEQWEDFYGIINAGGGFFQDLQGNGVFPELSVGLRYGGRPGKPFLYLYLLKVRHTFMFNKDKPDNTDFSIGLVFGYTPF